MFQVFQLYRLQLLRMLQWNYLHLDIYQQICRYSIEHSLKLLIKIRLHGYIIFIREATFLLECFMSSDVTFFNADLTQPITFKISTALIIFGADFFSSVLQVTHLLTNLWSFNLKALIIPASKNFNLHVVFLVELY